MLLAVTVVQRSIGFGRGVLFCRWLDAEALGRWEMAYGFLLLAAPLAVLGLPGSFGRYLVRFREQGRLRLFLRRTTLWTALLSAAAVAALILFRAPMAELVFGDPARAGLMTLVALTLAAVIAHHFAEAVLAGMRLFRLVSAMHFFQSTAFALIAVTLLLTWGPRAESIVVAYGLACVASLLAVGVRAAIEARGEQDTAEPVAHREFWPPLMRFAIWIWVANLLANLFAVIDRYMILHFGGFDATAALAQVGNYHAANIVPALMVSIANLLVGAVTPHLSHAWEQGRRDEVSDQLNLTLKLTALGMLAGGCAVLVGCPWLFATAFPGKYAEGLAVLPWAVVACVWFGVMMVAQTYAFCAEKSRRCALPLAAGLLANVLLNLLLLPRLGLLGAVVATALATLLALVGQLIVNQRLGMRLHRGTLLLCAAPAALTAGPAAAALMLCVAMLARRVVFSPEELAKAGTLRLGVFPRAAGA
ncbi:MurJ-like flippase [Pirellulimonas nuda]|uniref:MurJ-like flippase n=1 Tax=Pirellulimonas nuda TaxID=2528009 RepID=A0A518D7J8_9BACT|nr:MurJ-like flippase [Pirellulimonas nuda]